MISLQFEKKGKLEIVCRRPPLMLMLMLMLQILAVLLTSPHCTNPDQLLSKLDQAFSGTSSFIRREILGLLAVRLRGA